MFIEVIFAFFRSFVGILNAFNYLCDCYLFGFIKFELKFNLFIDLSVRKLQFKHIEQVQSQWNQDRQLSFPNFRIIVFAISSFLRIQLLIKEFSF